MPTVIDAIATGHPPHRRSQDEAAAFMQNIETLSPSLRSRLPAVYRSSHIDYRYSCIADYGRDDPSDFTFFPPNWALEPAPTTRQRNEHYRAAVVPLATDVAQRALNDAGLEASDVTHVVVASCTGFFAPGLDIELVKRLGLGRGTPRTFIGFMGCYAAFNALRVADSFCQQHPEARVLVVCAELCTLHFQVEDALESVVVNALFSDGAAAAVLSNRPAASGALTYVRSQTRLDDDSMDAMTWAIGNTGFLMGLSSRVPNVIAEHLPAYLRDLLPPATAPSDVGFWAIHPGGRAIVDKAREVIGLPPEAVRDSLEVLRQNGNMSSPTILFVLKRILERGPTANPYGAAMAFGPGLTIEGALLQWT
ncbi:type III polyketide synthase [Salisaeta longa]|uniref:type III polyketide synthase n=1 Tax=Salisaeta longa TaxID=503170 RepID=UPI0003FAE671|nr:type III polyketide synthase [Salisaeta longa]